MISGNPALAVLNYQNDWRTHILEFLSVILSIGHIMFSIDKTTIDEVLLRITCRLTDL